MRPYQGFGRVSHAWENLRFPVARSTRDAASCCYPRCAGSNSSIDGIGAFDTISRESMMRGLLDVEGGGTALPFVRMFYGSPSEYLWEDDEGTVHSIRQGEGSEQGDALMPLLFAVGQDRALEASPVG